VDIATLGQDLMRARGDLALRPAADIVDADFKEFDLAGHRVGIGQVEAVEVAPLVARRGEFMQALDRVRSEKGLLQVVMLVTDITHRGSHVWAVGDRRDVLEQALGQPLVDGAMYVEGCMSRKKQVVPPLEQAFARAGAASGPA
jgi:manganese-dependent inorganic pyrophosphatase